MKRLVAGSLWSLVTIWIGSYVALFVDVPTAIAIPFAALAGAFVILDPTGRIWPAPAEPAVASGQISPPIAESIRS
jgi:hypothetical protein